MIIRRFISTSILRAAISFVALSASVPAQAQKFFSFQKDSIPMFRGFAVSFDLVGAGMMAFSDCGQYEGALRINLHDEWFPIIEAGLGRSNHDDDVTHIHYSTSAPYFKIGVDKNLLKDKHGVNRLYGGLRYAFTSYKVDISRADFPDPVWLWNTGYGVKDAQCNQHWLEAVIGVDAKIFGPLHLGWSLRYKRRIAHKEGDFGNTWYVPGYGNFGDTRLGGTFNVIIDI
ncbi:DUF6048 family protein [Prevotella sp. P6B4]|uniref:DUF6048 family protein n=1 Tax=Prevotella sp. P6B4 TaxID=1410614 RepID=UPI00056B3E58|nr:DUF6048 family protein [Prevotella sp. P6B4]